MALLLDIAGLILCIWALRKIAKIDRGDKEESRASKKSSSYKGIEKPVLMPEFAELDEQIKHIREEKMDSFPNLITEYYFAFEREIELVNPNMNFLADKLNYKIRISLKDITGEWTVYVGDELVGNIPEGETLEKLSEWEENDRYYCGYISKIEQENSKVLIRIGFYGNESIFWDESKLFVKKFKLIRITEKEIEEDGLGESRHSNMEDKIDGDVVYITDFFGLDDDEENCVIVDFFGNELGELRTTDSKWVYDNYECIKFLKLDNIEMTDSLRYTADINVYYCEEGDTSAKISYR
ncbi:MAG: hypothetical protein IKJ06_03350 [Clostridia bacterium]|nr:hypothetical protein [Clostridia bacterium]